MSGFVDIHAHVLPGIDDGPPDLESALAMARAATNAGTAAIAATPHLRPDFPDVHVHELGWRCRELRTALEREQIAIQLVAGAEASLGWALEAGAEQLALASFAQQGRDLLIETPFSPVIGLERLLYELQAKGYRVTLAHPERSAEFQRDQASLRRLVDQGVLLQVNADSLVGSSGAPLRRFARHLCTEGLAHVLASDGHRAARWRPITNLAEGVAAAAELVGRPTRPVAHAGLTQRDHQWNGAARAPADRSGSQETAALWPQVRPVYERPSGQRLRFRHERRGRTLVSREVAGRPARAATATDAGLARGQIADPVDAYINAHNRKPLLRFVMCGSVDDGKSTLIGRLLYECQALFADQVAALEADSKALGTQGEGLDFALLLDGLSAEREQGITIDVAYRHFSTDRRHFMVADTPGHEQYTRNTVTGASTASCAVILVDARKGILTQTRRHSHVVSLLGIRDVALAVNKMDLVGYSESRFREIEDEYRAFAAGVGLERVTCIPVSALRGDNVLSRSEAMPGYHGPTLMGYLDTAEIEEERLRSAPFRLPVQWVNRPSLDFRGYAGTIASGTIRRGDRVVVAPSGLQTEVAQIVAPGGDLEEAVAGQSVTLTLGDERDVSRGDVIAPAHDPPGVADQFQATLVWMSEQPLLPGRAYLMKVGAKTVTATVAPLKHRLNVDSLEHVAATKLELNEIGVCDLELTQAIAFDPYAENREMGGFVLIDRITNNTVAAGMLHFALRRSYNLRWQPVAVDKHARATRLHQQPTVVWLTGLSGAGKSTIANLVEGELHRRGHHTYLLDGDNVRHGLNSDLGFTDADRVENIRRVSEVAHLMADAGLIVLVSFISPFRAERQMARSRFQPGEFLEVFVDAPLEVAEQRDPKGLYRKARRGELVNFTGIDSPYEPPERPELHLDTSTLSPTHAAQRVIGELERTGRLAPPGQA